MSSRARALLLLFAIVGLGFATAAAYVHYRLLTDPSYVSPCDISSRFSCSTEYLSRYGTVGGVPTAVLGVLWFALVAAIVVFARRDDSSSAAGTYLQALATIGLAVVLFLGYVTMFVLKSYCVLCMGVWASVIGIFTIANTRSGAVRMTTLPRRFIGDLAAALKRPAVLAVALIYLAGAASLLAFFPREATQTTAASATAADLPAIPQDLRDTFAKEWAEQPRVDLGVPADGAAVVIVKFNDYECPTCREAEIWYQPIIEKFAKSNPGAVKYVMKDWPWNAECNANLRETFTGHEASCAAAAAARMAQERGKFDEMKTWLFGHQETTPDAVKQAAGQILGVTDFDAEYTRELAGIQHDIAEGAALRVGATPTYFINGVRLPDRSLVQPQYFALAIELELQKHQP